MKNLLLACLTLLASALQAQKMTIRKLEMVNDKLLVHYEIDDSNPNNEYKVSLFASKDNYSAALTKVSGDIGEEVKPGIRKIIWDIRGEYGDFVGPLSVEVRANVYIPFVRLKNFTQAKTYKRGKSYPLEWRPGNTNPVHIEIFNGSERVQGELNHPNNGTYTVNFGKNLKPGAAYRLKITDARQSSDFIYTENFKVKRKLPLFFKIIPLMGVGYLGYTLISGAAGGQEDSLVDPPPAPTSQN